jgi:glycosyltransferase involved in cell wall biosynthesis/SAM-dependent methyltransferase
MSSNKNSLNNLISLLRCPKCGSSDLAPNLECLECANCLAHYPVVNEVPIFIANPNDVKVMPIDHISNQMPLEINNWLEELTGYSLNIGAGATTAKMRNCIEMEYSIWKNTDIVGDAHYLPFQDEMFDAVVCFNVFEHLSNPTIAAKEIFRILKPNGKLILRTAFLQPLHEAPIHFYNATKYGVMNWFSNFDIEMCHVSENFNPAFTLGWLASELLYAASEQYDSSVCNKLAGTTLEDWSQIWSMPSKRNGFLWETMLNLDQIRQERFSAGFELKASKPKIKTTQNQDARKIKIPEIVDTLDNFETISLIDKKRLLVTSRLECSKSLEKIGSNPWETVFNSHYELNKSPRISVIITLYNYSDYIYECLESVSSSNLESLPQNIEIIVVDDCSTDDSTKLVEEYLAKSNLPFCLLKKCLNTGLADARNIGINAARSPYVFILDADNWIYPSCLPVLYNQISLGGCAGVYGKIRKFDNQTHQEVGTISDKEWSINDLIQNPYIDAMAMFDREILLSVGGYSTELVEYGWFGWEDYDLWLKLAQHGFSAKLVPEVLSSYRVHDSSMINTTGKFILNMSRYFNYKFSELAQRNVGSETLFGSWRDEVCAVSHPNKLEPSLSIPVSKKLNEAYETINFMRSSRFWKLRDKWFNLKKMVGLV